MRVCIALSCGLLVSLFFFASSRDHRDLHSFPTRRSSDLTAISRRRVLARAKRRAQTLAQAMRSTRRTAPRSTQRARRAGPKDRKSTRLNSSHVSISYAVFCLKKKKEKE